MPADATVQVYLHLLDTVAGVENHGLVFFKLRREEPLAIDEGLLADIFLRHLLEVGIGDLDVVAENVIEAHFQALDAGSLSLFKLQSGEVLFGAAGDLTQFIQLLGKAALYHPALP